MTLLLTKDQIGRFNTDGFLIVEDLVDSKTIAQLRERFGCLFQGDFHTGIKPDEVNWQEAKSDPQLTRQICNAWKADPWVAATVLREDLGKALAQLGHWPGMRIAQDNVISKPPGARAIGYHQDNAYLGWYTPREMLTCWIALDDVSKESGTLELIKGSHRWHRQQNPEGEFHDPPDYRQIMQQAADREKQDTQAIYVEVPPGGGSFHHGWTWHGSGMNESSTERRALVLHGMPSNAQFVPGHLSDGTGPVYGRYKHLIDCEIDENYFPILWQQEGHRTPGLEAIMPAATG
jgi:ectoine hydroxylase-related dioxygenase (phytanoyl-CoA dioxygenase family)